MGGWVGGQPYPLQGCGVSAVKRDHYTYYTAKGMPVSSDLSDLISCSKWGLPRVPVSTVLGPREGVPLLFMSHQDVGIWSGATQRSRYQAESGWRAESEDRLGLKARRSVWEQDLGETRLRSQEIRQRMKSRSKLEGMTKQSWVGLSPVPRHFLSCTGVYMVKQRVNWP